jgi:hypothetical protein
MITHVHKCWDTLVLAHGNKGGRKEKKGGVGGASDLG